MTKSIAEVDTFLIAVNRYLASIRMLENMGQGSIAKNQRICWENEDMAQNDHQYRSVSKQEVPEND